ncbi:Hypothetical Protein FCC1311_062062 [Hondaea fermentalgiana]|uniref:Guanylate cyclase domain-containing protein n=1 Tax=Hondaea fermentalgiana TaxID=2315210 RepID=A0A2R5GGF2_9STRA|nr:Hypothetical Protein FCC1311_062062 [Hondaea fermentalgiana]|eukprot:GBG29986.1 Hypothetical Protein FCC1311_062062 [Hondaea fermentalgiana]
MMCTDVFSRYWKLVLDCVQSFEGDTIRIHDETAEIIFPVDPLFSSAASSTQEDLCQRRALTFALALWTEFQSFSLDASIRTENHLSLRLGIAFGDIKLDIVGGVDARCKIVSAGEAVVLAWDLVARAMDNQIVAHTSIEAIKPHALFSTPYARIGKEGFLAERLFDEFRNSRDFVRLHQSENVYQPAQVHLMLRKMSSDLKFANNPDQRNEVTRRAIRRASSVFDDDYDEKSIEALSRFTPCPVVRQIVAGRHMPRLDPRQCTVISILAANGLGDFAVDKDRLALTEKIMLIVQHALSGGSGDLLHIKRESSDFLLVGYFSDESHRAASNALHVGLHIIKELDRLGIRTSIGLASGECYLGVVGDTTRSEPVLFGFVPQIATRLASRGLSVKRSFLLFEQSTFVRLPASLSTKFGTSEAFLAGFGETVQVFFPEIVIDPGSCRSKALPLAELGIDLAFSGGVRMVTVADALPSDVRRLLFHKARSNVVDQILGVTSSVEQAETVRQIFQYIAVMAAVSSDINTRVLRSILPPNFKDEDMQMTLDVLRNKLQILCKAGGNRFVVNNVETDVKPLYDTLMHFFKKDTHLELARAYEDDLSGPMGSYAAATEHQLQIMIGSHYAQSGPEHHMVACSYINKGLSKIERNPERVKRLSMRCFDLARSWQQTQLREAEDAAARAMFVVGMQDRDKGDLDRSFAAFVACLRCYHELEPLLGPKCDKRAACRLGTEFAPLSPDQDGCHCFSLQDSARIYLFVHSTDDIYAQMVHFRAVEVSTAYDALVMWPLSCAVLCGPDQSLRDLGVTLEVMTESTARASYRCEGEFHDEAKGGGKNQYMRLCISTRETAHLIFNSLTQLASISVKRKAQLAIRSASRTEITEEEKEASVSALAKETASASEKQSAFCLVQ